MATFTPLRLAGPAFAAASATSVYTVGAGKTAVVKQIIFSNTSTSPVQVTANLVPVGGSAATSNAFIYTLSIGPSSEIIFSADIPLAAGEQIFLSAGLANTVNYIVSGIEIS